MGAAEVVEEFRSGGGAGDEQVVAGAGAGDVEEVAFGVVDLVEVGGSVTDSIRSWSGMTSSSQAMTATERNSVPFEFDTLSWALLHSW